MVTPSRTMSQKKDIKLLKKILKDPSKQSLYSPEELLYMRKQYALMKLAHKAEKRLTKMTKGFGK